MPGVHVIGAGMVGVCCALELQRRGWQVSLLDRRGPGLETSFGNAGVIGTGSIVPINNPGLWRALPALLRNTHPALRFDARHALASSRWIASFLLHATPGSTRRRASALHTLISRAGAAHRKLAAEAGVAHRLRETGWLKVFRSEASFRNSAAERAMLSEFAVDVQVLEREQLREMEPGLNPIFARALWYRQSLSVDNPGEVVAAYASLFARRGGHILRRQVTGIAPGPRGYRLSSPQGPLDAEHVVLALGPWSCDLLNPLGYDFPLGFERGYHRHLRVQDHAQLRRPVHDVDGAYVMTPTDLGLRVLSGVELKPRDAASSPAQLEQVLPRVAEAIALAGAGNTETWLGARPSLPDELPVIGEAPRHPRLWLAFGHQHVGFSTGPITGAIIASLMSGEDPGFDVLGFAPRRFI